MADSGGSVPRRPTLGKPWKQRICFLIANAPLMENVMIILYCNGRTYRWIDPYYIADRLACNESEWFVPIIYG